MKLFIKQKVFSFGDKFRVYDEQGNDRYAVHGDVFSFGKKLHLTDLNGEELVFIHQKVWSFRTKFLLARHGEDFATVIKEITFARPRYTVEGLGWTVTGDFWAHEYSVTEKDRAIATVSKKWMTWGDTYEIDIADGINEQNLLAVVLTIDAALAIEQSAAASN